MSRPFIQEDPVFAAWMGRMPKLALWQVRPGQRSKMSSLELAAEDDDVDEAELEERQ